MLLSANGELLVDKWRILNTDDDIYRLGDIIVNWTNWCERRDTLLQRSEAGIGEVALSLKATDPINDVLDDIEHFSLVVLSFENFADGRHFSHANMIKQRSSFRGELRAAGNIHRDQLAYLKRVGFDSFLFESDLPIDECNLILKGFSGVYQAAADDRETVRAFRASRGAFASY